MINLDTKKGLKSAFERFPNFWAPAPKNLEGLKKVIYVLDTDKYYELFGVKNYSNFRKDNEKTLKKLFLPGPRNEAYWDNEKNYIIFDSSTLEIIHTHSQQDFLNALYNDTLWKTR